MNDETRQDPPVPAPDAADAEAPKISIAGRLLRWVREAALLAIGIAVVIVLASGAFLYWLLQQRFEESGVPTGHELSFPAGVRPAVLYFAAASGDSLVPALRFLAESPSPAHRAIRLVEELTLGPEDETHLRLLPAGATVRHAFLDDDGRLYLDFEAGLARGFAGGSTAEYLCLSSLVRTLAANLPEVRSLTITVAGNPVPSLGGHFPLQEELEVSQWW